MSDPPELGRLLSRRQFLRQAGMAGMATTVATVAYGFGRPPPDSAVRHIVPRLDVPDTISGIAAMGDRLIAVGAQFSKGVASPAVWTHRRGDDYWRRTASGDAFPSGTVLAGVAGHRDGFLAAGAIRMVNRVQTLVDDDTGRRIDIPIMESRPAILSSVDGSAWEPVEIAIAPGEYGAFTCIATSRDGTTALAVGSKFVEPGIDEGYGLVAVTTVDGRAWEVTGLPGVEPPRHGAATLLARVRNQTLLAIRGAGRTSLHTTSGGPWESIAVPDAHASFVAAAADGESILLAGLDDSGAHRIWQRTSFGWRDIHELPGVPNGAGVVDFEEVDGSVVAAGSIAGHGFVARIGG